VIPVVQNNAPLAYVLIADTKEEAKGVSATIKHLNFVQTLSIIIFVAIENLRLFHKTLEQEAMKKELELASQMQNLLVPDNDSIPQTKEVKIHAFYHPHSEVGGDFYDVIELGKDEVGFCIADVSGKGMAAALLMSNFQANLRALFTHDITLTGLVEKLNERIMSTAKGERFITIFIGRYNRTRRQLEYVNAGHNPPVLYSMASNHISLLNEGCVGLGMVEDIPFISVGSIRISEKSKLLCYTDGLVEYINNNKVELSTKIIEQNLSNNDPISKNVQDIFKARKDKEQFEGFGIFDDISMLGFEFS
jgi:sigma-B regulation protein RsbU (phosphoserine phosphatase)